MEFSRLDSMSLTRGKLVVITIDREVVCASAALSLSHHARGPAYSSEQGRALHFNATQLGMYSREHTLPSSEGSRGECVYSRA